MPSRRRPPVHRIPVPDDLRAAAGFVDPDDAVAFECPADTTSVSARQWTSAMFEGAPAPMRLFMVAGWRVGLLLRLGPRRSPEHILGWRVVSERAQVVVMEASSPLLSSRLVVSIDDGRVRQCSFVRYEHRFAAVIWSPAAVLHRRIIPYLLRHTVTAAG